MPPSRPKSPPARPQPPSRPPLPTTPKHTPKAGVISIVKSSTADANTSSSVPHRTAPPVISSRPYQQTESNLNPLSNNNQTTDESIPNVESLNIQEQDSAIYEEIDDDVVSFYFRFHTDDFIRNIQFFS